MNKWPCTFILHWAMQILEPVLPSGPAVGKRAGEGVGKQPYSCPQKCLPKPSLASFGDVHPQGTNTYNGGPAGSKAETKEHEAKSQRTKTWQPGREGSQVQ